MHAIYNVVLALVDDADGRNPTARLRMCIHIRRVRPRRKGEIINMQIYRCNAVFPAWVGQRVCLYFVIMYCVR